jgi:hypothetical protein
MRYKKLCSLTMAPTYGSAKKAAPSGKNFLKNHF